MAELDFGMDLVEDTTDWPGDMAGSPGDMRDWAEDSWDCFGTPDFADTLELAEGP